MRIKIISFMTPLYVVGFFVLTWAVWAHTTCPDTAEATVLEKARIDLKFKQSLNYFLQVYKFHYLVLIMCKFCGYDHSQF